jgi:hypothetical protein
MEQMWYVLLGAGIFMVGGFFGMLIMALAVAASREMPKLEKKSEEDNNWRPVGVSLEPLCECGDPFKTGWVHTKIHYGSCYPKEN